jgi:hypothetical protein
MGAALSGRNHDISLALGWNRQQEIVRKKWIPPVHQVEGRQTRLPRRSDPLLEKKAAQVLIPVVVLCVHQHRKRDA